MSGYRNLTDNELLTAVDYEPSPLALELAGRFLGALDVGDMAEQWQQAAGESLAELETVTRELGDLVEQWDLHVSRTTDTDTPEAARFFRDLVQLQERTGQAAEQIGNDYGL
ncbi:MAG: hypothetical protein R3E46_04300 [Sedimenticolaceae bacterium]